MQQDNLDDLQAVGSILYNVAGVNFWYYSTHEVSNKFIVAWKMERILDIIFIGFPFSFHALLVFVEKDN